MKTDEELKTRLLWARARLAEEIERHEAAVNRLYADIETQVRKLNKREN